jgi:hypothetical protein
MGFFSYMARRINFDFLFFILKSKYKIWHVRWMSNIKYVNFFFQKTMNNNVGIKWQTEEDEREKKKGNGHQTSSNSEWKRKN